MSYYVKIGKNAQVPLTGEGCEAVMQAQKFKTWCQNYDKRFDVRSLRVDHIKCDRKGNPFFIDIEVSYFDPDLDRVVSRISKLRGDAVVVLIKIMCGEKSYYACVRENRAAAGLYHSLGLPAGMKDHEIDPRVVAVKELHEEAGISISPDKLTNLNEKVYGDPDRSVVVSAGWSDEGYVVFYGKIDMTSDELEEFNTRVRGNPGESEVTYCRAVEAAELLQQSSLGSTLIAHSLLAASGIA